MTMRAAASILPWCLMTCMVCTAPKTLAAASASSSRRFEKVQHVH